MAYPEEIAKLENEIFCGLRLVDAWEWRIRFLDTLNLDADYSLVWPKFAVWMLTSDELGLLAIADVQLKSALYRTVKLHARTIGGDRPSREEWSVSRSCAKTVESIPIEKSPVWYDGRLTDDSSAISNARLAVWWSADPASSAFSNWAASWAAEAVSYAAAIAIARPSEESESWITERANAKSSARISAYTKMADKLISLVSESPTSQPLCP